MSKKPTASQGNGELMELALKDLARSGLDKKDFKTLKLQVLDRHETDAFVGEPRASYKIPYFDVNGKEISYSRVRFLETGKSKPFSKGTREGSFRYSQPFNSSPHIYFPPYLDWKKIAKNPEFPVLITEGEKKAALACKMGLACFALGGVYGYKASKRLQDLIPEFAAFEWKGRTADICYDADVMMKSEVRSALSGLAYALSNEHGPEAINFVFLDAETAGPKTGLDDFLLHEGIDAFNGLERHPYRVNAKIQVLNQKICYAQKVSRFYDINHGVYYRNAGHLREAYLNAGEEVIDAKKTALIIDLWLKHPGRREVKDIIYEPGESEVTTEGSLNTWKAPSIRPKKGKPERWLELVHFIMRKPEYAEWFLKWLAYPVQYPGSKLLQAPFIYGEKQGVGKTFIVDPVMEFVYGETNFYRLSNDELASDFNSYMGHTQFVVTNEIYFSEFRDRRSTMSKLKDMITRERVTVNEKYVPKQVRMDHCNYVFTSNHPDALVLEKGDRRFFVVEAPDEKLDQKIYTELDQWVREENGAAVIMHYLRNTVDVSDFNPKGDALRTTWKNQLVELSRDALGEFGERVIEDAETLFMLNGHLPDLQLYRAEDILRIFEHTYPKYRFNVTVNRMARILHDPRVERRKVRLNRDAPQIVLYALFDREGWGKRKNSEWATHYTSQHQRHGGRGGGEKNRRLN